MDEASDDLRKVTEKTDSGNSCLAELIEWELPPQFQTELNNEGFDDIVLRQAAVHLDHLNESMMKLQTEMSDHLKSKAIEDEDYFTSLKHPHSGWKTSLTETSSALEILETAKASVVEKLPIKALKEFSLGMEKDRGN